MVSLLLGQYQVKVSLKGRAAFPKKFREVLGGSIILTRGYEGCLIAVSSKEWRTITETTENRPFIFGPARDTARFLLGNAVSIDLDSQGRFVVPPHLRAFGKITDCAIFLGLNRYVEIWDRKNWETYQEHLNNNINIISERLSNDDHEVAKRVSSSRMTR